MAKKQDDEIEITDDDIRGMAKSAIADEVDIEPADPAPDDKDAPTFEASETLKAELDELRRLNEEEKARADEAERAAASERAARQAATAEHAKVETELADTRLQTIGNALLANEGAMKDAKARYAAALQEGAFDKAADVQAEMSELSVKHQRLEEGRNTLEQKIEAEKDAPAPKPVATVDDWIETLPGAQRDWARNHKEWFASPAKNARVMAAHWQAVEDQGLREGSPQYFEFIETNLGLRQPARGEPARQDVQERPRVAPAAPVSRSSTSLSTGRPTTGKIRLPPEMVEAAQIAGLSPSEYWAAMTPEERARVLPN